MPFSIDWNSEIYKYPETTISFRFDSKTELGLYEIDIKLVEPTEEGGLKFVLTSDNLSTEFVLNLKEKDGISDFDISNTEGKRIFVRWGKSLTPVEEFFSEFPPTIWFVNGSELCGNRFTKLNKKIIPYPKEKIQTWDWTGTNIRKESQGTAKTTTTIQYRVIQELKKRDFDVIFDDDSSGEAADVVAIKVKDEDDRKIIYVELYHCKFSTEDTPGKRVKELYEVCGQSQRSTHWMEDPTELFCHLLRREEKRLDEKGITRIDHGDFDKLHEIMEMSSLYKTEMSVFAVQPGLSKKLVSLNQLELLSVTENYLKETYLIPFTVIASE